MQYQLQLRRYPAGGLAIGFALLLACVLAGAGGFLIRGVTLPAETVTAPAIIWLPASGPADQDVPFVVEQSPEGLPGDTVDSGQLGDQPQLAAQPQAGDIDRAERFNRQR